MRKTVLTVAIIGLVFLVPQAESAGVSKGSSSNPVAEVCKKMATKCGTGFANILGSFVELPAGIYWRSKKQDEFTGVFVGLGTSLTNFAERAVVGAFDVVTFPLPLSTRGAGYAPSMEPLDRNDLMGSTTSARCLTHEVR